MPSGFETDVLLATAPTTRIGSYPALYGQQVSGEPQASEVVTFGQSPGNDDNENQPAASSVLFSSSLFEGSPSYKRRRVKSTREKKHQEERGGTAMSSYESGDEGSGSEGELPFDPYYPASVGLHDKSGDRSLLPSLSGTYKYRRTSSIGSQHLPQHTAHLNPEDLSVRAPFVGISPTVTAAAPPRHDLSMPWSQNMTGLPLPSGLPGPGSTHFLSSAQTHMDSTPGPTPPNLGISGASQQKGFSCPLFACQRVFKRLEHLKRHVRTHTQERPYECTRCAKRFSRSDNLTQHIKTHEKADRGERMKTEASEGTEDDDMAKNLEAQVDAMVAKEDQAFWQSGHSGMQTYDEAHRFMSVDNREISGTFHVLSS